MDIPSISDARRILRALVSQGNGTLQPKEALQHATSFAALYPLYGFRPATSDLTSCALLAQACSQTVLRAPTADSPEVTNETAPLKPSTSTLVAIIPHLLSSLRFSGNKPSAGASREKSGDEVTRSVSIFRESGYTQGNDLERKWVTSALREIRLALSKVQSNQNGLRPDRGSLDVIFKELDSRAAL